MDGLIQLFLSFIKDAPGWSVVTMGFVVLIFAMYLKIRQISIEEVTSIGKLQSAQVATLLGQIGQLANDLKEARNEISSLYTKIDELENLVRHYKTKLRDEQDNS